MATFDRIDNKWAINQPPPRDRDSVDIKRLSSSWKLRYLTVVDVHSSVAGSVSEFSV